MSTTAGPRQSQEPQSQPRCLCWVTGNQLFRPSTCCFQGCTLKGSWNWELSWHLHSDIPIWDATSEAVYQRFTLKYLCRKFQPWYNSHHPRKSTTHEQQTRRQMFWHRELNYQLIGKLHSLLACWFKSQLACFYLAPSWKAWRASLWNCAVSVSFWMLHSTYLFISSSE